MDHDAANPLDHLVEALRKLPTVGMKTAQRLAHHLVRHKDQARALLAALDEVAQSVRPCSRCGAFTMLDPCRYCADARRDPTTVCVVQGMPDLEAVEASGEFHGRYHVLGGLLSPLKGVGPEELRVGDLLRRVGEEGFAEVIVAVSPTVDGEATALYLQRLLAPLGVRVTRPAAGMPMGADLEFLDRVTIARALAGRRDA